MPPIPTPEKGEKKQAFISRCASDSVMNKEYKDRSKKLGICFTQWRRKHPEDKKPKESKSSAEDYVLLQDEEGLEIIDLNKLPEQDIEQIEKNLENKEKLD